MEASVDTTQNIKRYEQVYAILLAVFVVLLVLTNIIGVKLFVAFPELLGNACFGGTCTLTSGIVTYPLTFLITDTVSELYGRKRADFMVAVGFVMSLVMVLLVQMVLALPGSSAWVNKGLGYTDVAGMQTAFESVFTLPGTLVFGSMTAYLLAQLLDNRLFHFLRKRTGGRHLWLRNNGSTMVFLGFGLGLPWPVVGQIMIAVYLFKLAIAAIDTPLVYLLVGRLRTYLNLPSAEAEYPASDSS
jgi:uncharacterized integral membrane protein (TIGR00697 family)